MSYLPFTLVTVNILFAIYFSKVNIFKLLVNKYATAPTDLVELKRK